MDLMPQLCWEGFLSLSNVVSIGIDGMDKSRVGGYQLSDPAISTADL